MRGADNKPAKLPLKEVKRDGKRWLAGEMAAAAPRAIERVGDRLFHLPVSSRLRVASVWIPRAPGQSATFVPHAGQKRAAAGSFAPH